jgi:uncharacterized protein YgiM (DUF1202 family)
MKTQKKRIISLALMVLVSGFFSANSYSSQKYFVEKQFIHLHKNESVNSIVILTLACGQEVVVISSKSEWLYISSGSFKGHALKRNFSKKRKACFSRTHSKLYNKIDLDMREVYKLGRLEDLFIYGEPEL